MLAMNYYVRVPFPPQRIRLKNGALLIVVQRPGVLRKLALWSVPFGSLQQSLRFGDSLEPLPGGVAHFLEHQLFREKDGSSVSDRFAALGLQDNAFTSFDQTGYHFGGAGNFEAALEQLLRFTSEPCFTEESVNSEREIITQELLMYRDIPEAVLELNLRKVLFGEHVLAQDIGGTPQSIAQVTPELLERCHAGFYHPQNAVLVVIGDLEAQAVQDLAEGIYEKMAADTVVQPAIGGAPPASGLPCCERLEKEMNVARPLMLIGLKEPNPLEKGRDLLLRQLESEMLLDLLFNRAAVGFWRLYRAGLINNTFHAGYQAGLGYAYTHIGGESERPEEFLAVVKELLFQNVGQWILEPDIDRLKRGKLGEFVGGFESFDNLAADLAAFAFLGVDAEEIPELLGRVTVASLKQRAAELFQPEHLAVSLISPSQG